MRSPVRIFRDADDVPRAAWKDAPARAEYLLRFLENDLGGDTTYISRVLSEGRAIGQAKSKGFRSGGNAYALKLTPKTAILYPNYDEAAKPFSLPLDDFLKVVTRWSKCVRD